MSTFNFLMLYDQKMASIGDTSARVARQYCKRHGYRFTCHREVLDPGLHPAWNKIVALRRHLGESEWTFWCDADTLICDPAFTMDRIVEQLSGEDIAISTDKKGMCSGLLLIRNTAWSARYLETLLFLGPHYPPARPKPLHEQETMNRIATSFPAVGNRIMLIPESVISNPRTPCTDEVPFIMHYWSSAHTQSSIIQCMSEMQEGGWSQKCMNLKKLL
jgi:hypothetical protein